MAITYAILTSLGALLNWYNQHFLTYFMLLCCLIIEVFFAVNLLRYFSFEKKSILLKYGFILHVIFILSCFFFSIKGLVLVLFMIIAKEESRLLFFNYYIVKNFMLNFIIATVIILIACSYEYTCKKLK